MRWPRALAASFSYFSILPTRSFEGVPDADAIGWLPVVGLVIGALSGGAAYGIWILTHSTIAMAIAAWLVSIALTGAIHVDGFLDCCDGLFAMATPERRLEIMRDPHHGTYAIVGMGILSALWIYALCQIPPGYVVIVLAMCGLLGRFFASAIARPWHYRRPLDIGVALVVLAFALLYEVKMLHLIPGVVLLLAAALAVGATSGFARIRLGRFSGDVYGAVVVVSEVVLLLGIPYALASQ